MYSTRITELKKLIEAQKEQNLKLYKSMPRASKEDPLNKKGEPILKQWLEGSKALKDMLKELQELELKSKNDTSNRRITEKVFVNSYGEATTRNITCSTYDNSIKRTAKEVLSFMGRK